MAKSLGQIHTANFAIGATQGGSYPQYHQLDAAGHLAARLQHQVRQGNIFKVVGIDMTIRNTTTATNSAQVSGEIQYCAPSKGRVGAYQNAFKAMMRNLKLAGVNVRGNRNYDFRCYMHHPNFFTSGSTLVNAATFDGTNPLQLIGDSHSSNADEVFDTWNRNLQPAQTASVDFDMGFGIQGTTVEYALNQGEIFDPTETSGASTSLETIPFTLSYDPAEGTAFQFDWQPDPALYLAVMCGLFVVKINEVQTQTGGDQTQIAMSIHIAGWKSMMGSGKRRRRTSKKTSKKTSSHRGRRS